MPKSKAALTINLNLLKPQSNSEKLPIKFISWLLSSGRYIFTVVNALVLIAFITRFKFDADLAAKNEAIAEQIPYVESLRPYELLIKDTQLKLSTIGTVKKNVPDWSLLLKNISDQVPLGITISAINIDNNIGSAKIHISGQTQLTSDVTNFMAALREDSTFSNVNLASIALEQSFIKFAIDAQAKLTSSGRSSL